MDAAVHPYNLTPSSVPLAATCRYAALDARAAADNSRLSDEYQASLGVVVLVLFAGTRLLKQHYHPIPLPCTLPTSCSRPCRR